MTIKGPWYISAQAVRDLLGIKGLRVADDGPEFDRAELELIELAERVVADRKEPKPMGGLLMYRGPRPLRLRLIVSESERAEGSHPQLVGVKPDHEGRAGSYTRSAPMRNVRRK